MTVSKVTRLAKVSKASFYEQFVGKEECFAATCDTALREAATAVLRGEAAGKESRARLRAGLLALADLIAAQPAATKLVLIDSLSATPAIRDHVLRRFGLLEALVRDRLEAAGRGGLSKAVTTAVLRGIEHHIRRCVGTERPAQFRELVDPLLDWGLDFSCEEATAVFSTSAPLAARSQGNRRRVSDVKTHQDPRGMLVMAALKLALREGYPALTPSRIRRTAGVSRRSFDVNFEDVASCFLAAVEGELRPLFLLAPPAGLDWAETTCLGLKRLSLSLAEAPDLARLAFVETLAAAPRSLRWRERILAEWAESLYRGSPTDSRPSSVVAEATVAAIWGFIGDLARTDRLYLLPSQTGRLSLFTLTPVLGAPHAAEVIRTGKRAPIDRSYERFLLSAGTS